MEQEVFTKYLTDRYEGQISWYDGKAISNQKIYRSMQWLLIVLAAVTPVLIELEIPKAENIALQWATVPSIVVAVLTAGLKAFKYQENWISYRTICESLKKERHYFDAEIGEYHSAKDKNALFVDRVEALISRENTIWISTHKQDPKAAANSSDTS